MYSDSHQNKQLIELTKMKNFQKVRATTAMASFETISLTAWKYPLKSIAYEILEPQNKQRLRHHAKSKATW